MMAAATTTAAGIPTRNRRTHRLWRNAARNTRTSWSRSRDAYARVARSSTCEASARDATVKRLPQSPSPVTGSGGLDCLIILSNPTAPSPTNVAPPRHIPLNSLAAPCDRDPVHHARLRKHSRMRKYVLRGPACEVEAHPIGQEPEAGLRQAGPALTRQHAVELGLQRMQMQHIRSRIGDLRVRELRRAPVGELLLLREVDAEQLLHQIFQTMLIGVSARQ